MREVERHVVVLTTRDGLPETGIDEPLNPLRRAPLDGSADGNHPVKQLPRHVDAAPEVESYGCRAGLGDRRVIVEIVVSLEPRHNRDPSQDGRSGTAG